MNPKTNLRFHLRKHSSGPSSLLRCVECESTMASPRETYQILLYGYVVFSSLSSLSFLCILARITWTGRLATLNATATPESGMHLFHSRAVTFTCRAIRRQRRTHYRLTLVPPLETCGGSALGSYSGYPGSIPMQTSMYPIFFSNYSIRTINPHTHFGRNSYIIGTPNAAF